MFHVRCHAKVFKGDTEVRKIINVNEVEKK